MKTFVKSKAFNWLLASVWVPVAAIMSYYNYKAGVLHENGVYLIDAPYQESRVLKYHWSGTAVRSCEIVLEREMFTSEGVVVTLKPTTFAPLSVEELGTFEIDVEVETPSGLPAGITFYKVTERPKCNWLQRLFPPAILVTEVMFDVTS